MQTFRLAALAAVAFTATLATVSAEAAPCSTPTAPIDTTNMSFRGSIADDCSRSSATNDRPAGIGSVFGGGWNFVTKTDDGPAVNYSGLSWDLSAGSGSTGTFNLLLSGAASALPQMFDLAFVVKGGNTGYATYFFDNELFTALGSTSGTYQVAFTNSGGQIPDLSHMSVYARVQERGTVPEPSMLALLGIALLGAGVARKKKA
jgi:WD40 repeat protein